MIPSNELIFILHTCIVSLGALAALKLGREALVAFIGVQCILANLFVTKQMTLCGLTATCSDAFTIGSVIGLNLLQEYFGKEITKKSIWINFFLLLLYIAATQIHLLYIPSMADTMHQHCYPLLALMPRIVFASVAVFFVVQQLDYLLYGFLKKKFHNRHLVMRNYASIIICQLFDTVLFSFLGLYGIVDDVLQVICVSYTVKLIAIVLATPFIGLSKRVIKLKPTARGE
jgi:queuosine precursor transporter